MYNTFIKIESNINYSLKRKLTFHKKQNLNNKYVITATLSKITSKRLYKEIPLKSNVLN